MRGGRLAHQLVTPQPQLRVVTLELGLSTGVSDPADRARSEQQVRLATSEHLMDAVVVSPRLQRSSTA